MWGAWAVWGHQGAAAPRRCLPPWPNIPGLDWAPQGTYLGRGGSRAGWIPTPLCHSPPWGNLGGSLRGQAWRACPNPLPVLNWAHKVGLEPPPLRSTPEPATFTGHQKGMCAAFPHLRGMVPIDAKATAGRARGPLPGETEAQSRTCCTTQAKNPGVQQCTPIYPK